MHRTAHKTDVPIQASMVQADVAIEPFDLHATMAQQLLGRFDPTGVITPGSFVKVHLDSDGHPLLWRFRPIDGGFRVEVEGATAERALAAFLAQFPLDDGADSFHSDHPLLDRLARGFRGMRLMRMPWAFDVAAGAVMQQRVRWQDGYSDFARIARRWGTRTRAGIAFPSAQQLARVSPDAIEAMQIDSKRARAVANVARLEASRRVLERERDPQKIIDRMLSLPGIGPWTAHMTAGYALGDCDAVPVGDLHLPSFVVSALAGEPDGTDERMLELLEPCRGQRFRVIRMLLWAATRTPHILTQRVS